MSSVNISITKDVYDLLSRMKKDDESFSEVIRNMAQKKDITKCYGLFKGDEESMAIIEREALKARKERWREIKL